jgi:hypothetical protein
LRKGHYLSGCALRTGNRPSADCIARMTMIESFISTRGKSPMGTKKGMQEEEEEEEEERV